MSVFTSRSILKSDPKKLALYDKITHWFWCTCLLHQYFLNSVFFLLPTGGRGSYNDIGGPVITTQVTIPKDVSNRTLTCLPFRMISVVWYLVIQAVVTSQSWCTTCWLFFPYAPSLHKGVVIIQELKCNKYSHLDLKYPMLSVSHISADEHFEWPKMLSIPRPLLSFVLLSDSWLGLSLEREANGSSRSAMNLALPLKLTNPWKVLRTGSSPSLAPRTRSRMPNTFYRTGEFS